MSGSLSELSGALAHHSVKTHSPGAELSTECIHNQEGRYITIVLTVRQSMRLFKMLCFQVSSLICGYGAFGDSLFYHPINYAPQISEWHLRNLEHEILWITLLIRPS